jgi:hypothetical protein
MLVKTLRTIFGKALFLVLFISITGGAARAQKIPTSTLSNLSAADVRKPQSDKAPNSAAIATKVLVRAVARDAKVIYDRVGGAKITIKELSGGKILAEGVQKGGSGDSTAIMIQPRARGVKVFDTPGTAGFSVTLMLEKPTLVEITAEGPLNYPNSMQRASKTVLLVPGEEISGEGILLELHGFIVAPAQNQPVMQITAGHPFDFSVLVMMLCGCPTEPKGMWDADKIKVTAKVLKGEKVIEELQLNPVAGQLSTFSGKLKPKEKGQYQIRILAIDSVNANFGIMEQKFVVD